MSKPLVKASAACWIAATLLWAVAGCSASYRGVECTFNIHNVHESTGAPGWMDVKATGKCTRAAERATVKIGIQKLVNGRWVYVPKSNAERAIEPVTAGKKYTAMSSDATRCSPGTYRGFGSGTLTVNGKTSPGYQLGFGPAVTLTC